MEKEFVDLINCYRGILHKICNIYFYRSPYIEDYYQEILIRLWKSYSTFKNQSAVSTWIYRVALNTAIDIVRMQRIRPKLIELSKSEYNISAMEPNLESDRRDQLYRAINTLSDAEKAIIILYLEDYGYKEIAEIMGISESNTGVKINRIKLQLIKILGNGQQ